jgi:hypothetical protein
LISLLLVRVSLLFFAFHKEKIAEDLFAKITGIEGELKRKESFSIFEHKNQFLGPAFNRFSTTELKAIPTSCPDLWSMGHIWSVYSVKGSSMVENVYCDFTKLPSKDGKRRFALLVLRFHDC